MRSAAIRGGRTSKIHAVTDENGRPLAFVVTVGNAVFAIGPCFKRPRPKTISAASGEHAHLYSLYDVPNALQIRWLGHASLTAGRAALFRSVSFRHKKMCFA